MKTTALTDKTLGLAGTHLNIELRVSGNLVSPIRQALDLIKRVTPDKWSRFFEGNDPKQKRIRSIIEGNAPVNVAGWHDQPGVIHLNTSVIAKMINNTSIDLVEGLATILLHEASHEEYSDEMGPKKEEEEFARKQGKESPVI